MVRKTRSLQAGYVHVDFELPACLWADHIFVVGEFNDWNTQSLPMRQDRNGVWHLTLELAAGHSYQFRYLVDDHWLTDSHADTIIVNNFGSENSVVNAELPVDLCRLAVEAPLQ